jgi:CHAT domain-containing protein
LINPSIQNLGQKVKHLRKQSFFVVLIWICLCSVWPNAKVSSEPHAQTITETGTESNGLSLQPAELLYQAGRFQEAIAVWQQMLAQTTNPQTKAALHNNLAIAYRQTGKISEAIDQWQQALIIYQNQNRIDQNSGDRLQIAKIQVDQAQAYTSLGQHRQGIDLLKSVVALIAKFPQDFPSQSLESQQLAIAIRVGFGNAYFTEGDYDQALAFYQEGISLTTGSQTPSQASPSLALGWLNMANALTKRAERHKTQIVGANQGGESIEVTRLQALLDADVVAARMAYDRSLIHEAQKTDPIFRAKILLNFAYFLQDHNYPEFVTYQQQAATLLNRVANSREKAEALIALAAISAISKSTISNPTPNSAEITILKEAIATAENIGDQRTQSFALGSLGRVYEMQGDLNMAIAFTDRALWLAQQINASDSLYRWQWQTGRIYKAQGKPQEAIVAYRQAIASLQSIRSDIIAADRSFQFDVRDEVEPVYRELMELLLAAPTDSNRDRQIEEALQVLELLRLSELQNFFGDECIEIKSAQRIDQIFAEQKAAFIYSVVLDRQTFTILRLPDGSLKTYNVARSREQLTSTIKSLRFSLENIATDEYLAPAKEVYDLLIRPMEADLARSQIDLLVFINDGSLRSVPMAALHDGKQFLIEKYPVVSLLGTSLSSKPTNSQNIRLLSFGLSEAIAPFAALPNVPQELQGINNLIPGEKFLNRDFTFENLTRKVKEGYNVIHLATHAKFGTTPQSTFLQAFDRQISLEQLETILRSSINPIELLVLSACQTAAGDNRATLGLAGVALRSGVKSVIATLWAVNDSDVVPFITDFYSEWRKPGVSKAEALRKAQIKSIASYSGHPAIWSSFILVGN